MTKKVLVLSASFRKRGNSDILCDQFILGAQEAGNEVEKIYVNDKHIGYCMGCGACNTTHKCVQNDDMAEILDKMVNADVIVMDTPVYFDSMNGQMKTLIRLRKNEETFRSLHFHFPDRIENRRCVEYIKLDEAGRKIEVLLNCSDETVKAGGTGEVLFARNYQNGILEKNGTLIRRI